jgi:hypothetical protein
MSKKFYKEDGQVIPAILYEDSIPLDFTEVTDESELKYLYTQKYKQQKIDGENYYLSFQAQLYLDVVNGIHTDLEVFEFEDYTNELSNQISRGNWLTAQTTCSNLATSGIFDTTKKAEVQAEIDDYVTNNY